VDERICSLRMGGKFNNCSTLISVHAPTEEKCELVKESFFDKFHHTSLYQRTPAHDTKIIRVMGDLMQK